jgi:NitT/TauT family transport system ATP-binding protein
MISPPAISSRGVSCRYPRRDGGIWALRDIDLDVEAGEFVSVLGPSGSGKSTFLRLVAGLRPPDAGVVTVLGTTPDEAGRAKRIGFAPQSPALLPWASVLANVSLPLLVNRRSPPAPHEAGSSRDPFELLERVGLADVAGLRPGQLSGGMAQRVAIARALVTDPELLVMDEPFSALDELTREVLRDVLLDLWAPARTTVLWVTHSVAEAVYLSDRVVVLSAGPGRIVGQVVVELPRPRTPEMAHSPEWAGIEDDIRAVLRTGWARGKDRG